MPLKTVLRVLYAPQKAFEEIIENPKYLGPFLVMILFVAAQVGFFYTVASQSYFELTTPSGEQLDVWTENATLWKVDSGILVRNNYSDFVNGTYLGNSSIEFSASDRNNISFDLRDLNSINCGSDGFNDLSFRVKILSSDSSPEKVTLYLYSSSPAEFFYKDISQEFSTDTLGIWNNLTVKLGNENWLTSSDTSFWESITGLKLEFEWNKSSNINLLFDGLFFRGDFRSLLEIGGTESLTTFAITAFSEFIFRWVLLTGILYGLISVLKGKVTWKPLMVAVGYALILIIVFTLISIIAYSSVSSLYYPLELLAGIPGEFEVASEVNLEKMSWFFQISAIAQLIVNIVWLAGLCAIIVRTLAKFSWVKSVIISVSSAILTIYLLYFLLGI